MRNYKLFAGTFAVFLLIIPGAPWGAPTPGMPWGVPGAPWGAPTDTRWGAPRTAWRGPTSTFMPAPAAQACDENPPPGYTKTIRGLVDGDELTLTVSSRFGGAVESVTWRGKEFINTWDHGREISYAWGMDDYGECLNPTEPGSASDYQDASSTSLLQRVCTAGESSLTTTTRPAYWLIPSESGFCAGGAKTAVNDSPLTDQRLEKTIEIGYRGLDNVIAFTAVITLPESYKSNNIEIPTGYLTYEFKQFWNYNPLSRELTEPVSDPVSAPWWFAHFGPLPPILSTEDGNYAMGAYSDELIQNYGIYATNMSNPRDRTNKWNIVMREQPAPAGTYTYRSFVIVGTLDEVQAAMSELYQLHPVDFNPPTGYIDVVNCSEIAGWAWDPKTPDQPIEVEFYAVESDGTETLLGLKRAANPRQDLVTALGDNGEHGYAVPTSTLVHDNRRVVLKAYAINSAEGLPARPLVSSHPALECPQFGPPAPTTEPKAESSESAPATSPSVPCLGGLLPAALVIGLGYKIRRSSRAPL